MFWRNPFIKVSAYFSIILLCSNFLSAHVERPRLVVMADIGHDPDEEQQIIHMLMTSNQFDLVGLMAVTGRFFRPDPPALTKDLRPYLFHRIIDAYAEVYPNLKKHAKGWHSPEYLRGIVCTGQTGNGMQDVGDEKDSPGSRKIIDLLTNADPRPLHIVINSGSNTLAQALYDYRANHTEEETKELIAKLRIYENSGQDDAGTWICREFPDIHWVRSTAQNRGFGGPGNTNLGPHVWKPFEYSAEGQHQWATTHIINNHGALGSIYPFRKVDGKTHYLEGGGTIPLLHFAAPGLTDPSRPSWGGWGGRFGMVKQRNVPSHFRIVQVDENKYRPYEMYNEVNENFDVWYDNDGHLHQDIYTSVFRWRRAMWNDFKARMDWCVKSFAEVNHHPNATINGDTTDSIYSIEAKAGSSISFDASASSDPDNDPLEFSWWIYEQAGTYMGEAIELENKNTSKLSMAVPHDAAGKSIHIILELTDVNPIASLTDYRRIIVQVK